jgi:hypothetical protein
VLQGVAVSKMALGSKPELCGVSISSSRVKLSKVMRGIGPRMHKGTHSYGFGGDAGKNIKGMGRDNVREVRDYSNAVPGIGSIVERRVSGRGSMRKSRGRLRT